jgi:hypothetical protein
VNGRESVGGFFVGGVFNATSTTLLRALKASRRRPARLFEVLASKDVSRSLQARAMTHHPQDKALINNLFPPDAIFLPAVKPVCPFVSLVSGFRCGNWAYDGHEADMFSG